MGMFHLLRSQSEHSLHGAAPTMHLFCNTVGHLLSGAGSILPCTWKSINTYFFHSFVAVGWMWRASTLKARDKLNKKEYCIHRGQMETSDKRNIPSPRSAGISKHRFKLRYLNSFFAPEGQCGLLALCYPSPQLPSSMQVQRALQLLPPEMAKTEVKMVKLGQ